MNPALNQEFHFFCEQEQLQKHATLDKNPYCVYGTLKCRLLFWLLSLFVCCFRSFMDWVGHFQYSGKGKGD